MISYHLIDEDSEHRYYNCYNKNVIDHPPKTICFANGYDIPIVGYHTSPDTISITISKDEYSNSFIVRPKRVI